MKTRSFLKTSVGPFLLKAGKFLFKSRLLMLLLALCVFGFIAGKQARPNPSIVPYEELFENLRVLSYRETPSDSNARFIVELSARGRVFQQYDVDARRFLPPTRGHDYARSITGTRYRPLKVRGHVEQGFWLELPDSTAPALLPDQFAELYRSTLDFVKPLSTATSVLGILSGYSIGYRAATWSSSLANPKVQERVFGIPGIGRVIAREAWRRVLLEPVVMANESDAERFTRVRGTQRIYTNFFRLALNDSDRFIPHEAARLDSAGRQREARLMVAFAEAVRRAACDACDLTSADFRAIEDWASLLDRRGHWSNGSVPRQREDRMKYFGTLAWYGIAPVNTDERRIWVGPRMLVRDGDMEGFVADEIPSLRVGCPIAWRDWMRPDRSRLAGNEWTAQWMRDSREFAQMVDVGRELAGRLHGSP